VVISGKRWSDAPTRFRLRDAIMICVGNDAESLEALRRVFRTMPCRVLMTDQPQEALRWVEASSVSLVMADQWLKDMSGARLLKEVMALSPGTARFLLAATPDGRDQLGTDDTAIHGMIAKPWDGTALRRTALAILKWHEERVREPEPRPPELERRRAPRHRTGSDDVPGPSLA
jgi:response regulator RpfG family c-di-GMP phosphodiesterase